MCVFFYIFYFIKGSNCPSIEKIYTSRKERRKVIFQHKLYIFFFFVSPSIHFFVSFKRSDFRPLSLVRSCCRSDRAIHLPCLAAPPPSLQLPTSPSPNAYYRSASSANKNLISAETSLKI